jgi:hypothetical protein
MQSEVGTQLIGLWIGIMSFLGWTPESTPLLFPKNILLEITETKKEKTSTEEKTSETKPKVKETLKNEDKKDAKEIVKEKIQTPHVPSIEDVVVNIYCTFRRGNKTQTVSGSAVRLEKDIYLTNAHVAEYIMLENYFTEKELSSNTLLTPSCTLRELSPAQGGASAEIIFLPTSWVHKNITNLKQINPTGTGEHDYALVREVKNTVNKLKTNVSLPLAKKEIKKEEEVFLIGYPIFDQGSIKNNLRKVSEKVGIEKIFSFGGKKVDTFNTGNTTLAHLGSSGGAVITLEGELAGIMVATVNKAETNAKEIKAIGINYIERNILKESGKTLDSFIKDTDEQVLSFRDNYLESLSELLLEGAK